MSSTRPQDWQDVAADSTLNARVLPLGALSRKDQMKKAFPQRTLLWARASANSGGKVGHHTASVAPSVDASQALTHLAIVSSLSHSLGDLLSSVLAKAKATSKTGTPDREDAELASLCRRFWEESSAYCHHNWSQDRCAAELKMEEAIRNG